MLLGVEPAWKKSKKKLEDLNFHTGKQPKGLKFLEIQD